tara:strand:- start:1263 stop:2480 length:1218 start_codon:yes stop_codon:yes gene_type:complete
LKILYITPSAAHQLNYIESIYREGHEVIVLTNDLTFHLKRLTKPTFESSFKNVQGPLIFSLIKKILFRYKITSKLIKFLYKNGNDSYVHDSYDRFLKKLIKQNFDIVISYKGHGLDYIEKFQRNGSKWIVDEVNSHPDFVNRYLTKEAKNLGIIHEKRNIYSSDSLKRIKQAYYKSDYILCSSNHVLRTIKKRTEVEQKFIFNPYGCPHPVLYKKKVNLDTINLICVARVHFRKGIKYLLEVFDYLDKNFPNKYNLTIIGSRSHLEGFDESKTNPRINFMGVRSKDKIKKIFLKSHIFILPSLEEGQALVIGEALSHGLPIISTSFSGVKDYPKDKKLLIDSYKNLSIQIINPKNIVDFSSAVLKISNKKDYLTASKGSIEIAKQNTWHFSGQELVRKLELIKQA